MSRDPATSVLDADCRAHGINNLHVADASFMLTSMGINPILTIAANALRVAKGIARRRGRGMSVTDGIAVVTGAGGGQGRALALELAARGGNRAQPQGIEETAAMAPEGRIMAVVADVADANAVRAAFARIADAAPVSVLINNATVYRHREFLEEDGESFAATVGTDRGRIINVSTFADMAALPGSSAYAVRKGAGRILTRALNGAVFEMNRKVLPPRGLKRQLKDTILMRRPPRADHQR